jgi:hypothetical protein
MGRSSVRRGLMVLGSAARVVVAGLTHRGLERDLPPGGRVDAGPGVRALVAHAVDGHARDPVIAIVARLLGRPLHRQVLRPGSRRVGEVRVDERQARVTRQGRTVGRRCACGEGEREGRGGPE